MLTLLTWIRHTAMIFGDGLLYQWTELMTERSRSWEEEMVKLTFFRRYNSWLFSEIFKYISLRDQNFNFRHFFIQEQLKCNQRGNIYISLWAWSVYWKKYKKLWRNTMYEIAPFTAILFQMIHREFAPPYVCHHQT